MDLNRCAAKFAAVLEHARRHQADLAAVRAHAVRTLGGAVAAAIAARRMLALQGRREA